VKTSLSPLNRSRQVFRCFSDQVPGQDLYEHLFLAMIQPADRGDDTPPALSFDIVVFDDLRVLIPIGFFHSDKLGGSLNLLFHLRRGKSSMVA
jgi:hypothetical protein